MACRLGVLLDGILFQFAADNVDLAADEAYDVRRVNLDIAAVDHHVDGMLERVPKVVYVVDVFFGKLGGRAQDGLVEMLEEFGKERVRRDADADFRALDVELAGNVRIGGENECVVAISALR